MSSSSTFQFAVNLNSQEDHGHDHNHDHDHHQDNGGSRPVVDEVDFFAASNKKVKLNLVDGDAESNRPNSPSNNEMDCHVNTGLKLLTTNTSSGQSMVDDTTSSNSDEKRSKYDEVNMLQAELQRVSTENQRLKDMLNQATSNHNDLQLHFMTLVQQQQQQQQQSDRQKMKIHKEDVANEVILKSNNNGISSKKLLDLVLSSGKGRAEIDEQLSPSTSDHMSRDRSSSPAINAEVGSIKDREGTPEERVRHQWSTHKVASQLSPPKPNTGNVVEPQAAAEATMRKARVSVRARSEAAMITDGCQWRKYGQKMAKGNPCPRAYYRCTMAGGCPVRKQVQRCAEDRGILITTYEGNHNHPLPPAAMAMASTTSSAARMLLSGSMPSAEGLVNPNFLARTLVPCSSSMATISASAPFPTVTLDLTQPPATGAGSAHVANSSTATAAALFPQMLGQALYNNQSNFSGPQELAYSVNAAALSSGDPDFTAALAAAITSIIGGSGTAPIASGGNNSGGNNIGCDSATLNTSSTTNNIK